MNWKYRLLVPVLLGASLAGCTATIGTNGVQFQKVKQPAFLEALVDIATDELLSSDPEPVDYREEWLTCQQAGENLETTRQRYENCAERRARIAAQGAR
jgi:hypothetical protein